MADLKFIVSASAQDFSREMENVKSQTGSVKKQMRSLTQETINLEQAYRNLSKAEKNSDFGKYLRQEIDKNIAKAAEYKDTLDDVQSNIAKMADDTAIWQGMSEGIGVARDTVSAFATSLGLSTKEGGLAADTINMLARAQTFANAAISIGNALQKNSKLMSAITTLQLRAQAAATNSCTVAQAAFNAVANANPYLLLISALVTVVSVLALFADGTDEAAEKQEKLEKEMEETRKKAEEQRNTFLSSAAQYHANAEELIGLYAAYKKSNTELEKTAILNQAKEKFKQLGIEVNGVSDAERILTSQIGIVTQLMKLQGDAAGVAALRMERFKDSMKKMMENGYSVGVASSLAGAAVKDFDEALNKINQEIMAKKRELNIKDKSLSNSNNNKKKIDYEKDSLEDLQNQLSLIENTLKKKNKLHIDVDKAKSEIERLKNEIKNKEIELGIKQPDPKDVPFTEAWYNEQIKNLKDKKALLPVDAYVEREQLQTQIDTLNIKLKLQLEGIQITGSQTIADVWSNKTKKSVSAINEAISALNQRLQETDWSKVEPGAHTLDDYISKIQELKAELVPLEDMLLSPLEKSQKKLKQQQESIQSVGNAISAAGELFSELGKATDDEGLQVMGIVAKAVATVALSYAQALASTKTWVDWLAFGMTGLGTMISMITSIKSATNGYAEGGIIGGNSFYGDRILARVNSGEVILNKRQQQRAYELMDNGFGGANINVTGVVRGRELVLVTKNESKYMSRSGRKIQF